jgi:hypothetical protein
MDDFPWASQFKIKHQENHGCFGDIDMRKLTFDMLTAAKVQHK